MSPVINQTTYPVKLIDRRLVAERTMVFQLEKPEGFTFKAGQFIDIALINPSETDSEGNSRAFSIASAPEEDVLMVATRMRDTAFKRVLRTMPLGTAVTIGGPFGNLVLHANATRPAVLLAGGIGITPFRSILQHATNEKLPHRMVLFYSNRRPEDAPFLEELQDLEGRNPKYTFVGTMTDMGHSHSPWQGESGSVSIEMLSKYVRSLVPPIYYLAGPPGMVKAMRSMLKETGIKNEDIRVEEFSGY